MVRGTAGAVIASLPPAIHINMTTDHCAGDADIFQLYWVNRHRVGIKNGAIGALARFEAANLAIHFQ